MARFLLIFVQATVLFGFGLANCPSRDICVGLQSSQPTSVSGLLQTLNSQYCGCRVIQGNVVIALNGLTTSGLTSNNFAFLSKIEEITGYLEITGVTVTDRIILPELRVIQGRDLKNGRGLIIDGVTSPSGVLMPKLSEVVRGDAYFSGLSGRCTYETVNWEDIVTNGSQVTGDTNSCTAVTGDCRSCGSGYCWNPSGVGGEKMCQILTHVNCPCSGGRCYNGSTCCDPTCVGGCTGLTNQDCFACESFSNNGECVHHCPSRVLYNESAQSVLIDSLGRLTTGSFCVEQCPDGLYSKDGTCVPDCGSALVVESGKCVPPAPQQPRECNSTLSRDNTLSASNYVNFRNCNIINGHLWITDDLANSMSTETEGELKQAFQFLEEIRGSVVISSYEMLSLSFLSNVRVIGSSNPSDLIPSRDVSLYSGHQTAILIERTQRLAAVDLSNLETVRGDVILFSNQALCYVGNFSYFTHESEEDMVILGTQHYASEMACETVFKVCDEECDPVGRCWGESNHQCVRCRNYRDVASGSCVQDCSGVTATYTNTTSRTCEPCHEDCLRCSGPGREDCTVCRNLSIPVPQSSSMLCVPECPDGFYVDGSTCQRCDSVCGQNGCTGPSRFLEVGGCVRCSNLSESNGTYECVDSPPPQHYGTVLFSSNGHVPVGVTVYRACHISCENCTGPTAGDCTACRSIGEDNSCVPPSPTSTSTGTSAGTSTSTSTGTSTSTSTSTTTSTTTPSSSGQGFDPVIAVAVAVPVFCLLVFIILILVFILVFWCCKKTKTVNNLSSFTSSTSHVEMRSRASEVPVGLFYSIPSSEIEIGEKIKEGQFSVVHQGNWVQWDETEMPVAVKKLKEVLDISLDDSAILDLRTVVTLNHPHLVKFHGICVNGCPSIVTDYVQHGGLDVYLAENAPSITAEAMMKYMVQVAEAMAYLELQKIPHGSLSARNVLVHSSDHVKVSDIGMLNVIQQGYKDTRNVMAPIRWLAPECFRNKITPSIKSDVWSFGVTMWEILTYGQYPYNDLNSPGEVIYQIMKMNTRLPPIGICTDELYDIISQCWTPENDRPTFKQLDRLLSEKSEHPDTCIISEHLLRKAAFRERRPAYEEFFLDDLLNLIGSPDSGVDSLGRASVSKEKDERLV